MRAGICVRVCARVCARWRGRGSYLVEVTISFESRDFRLELFDVLDEIDPLLLQSVLALLSSRADEQDVLFKRRFELLRAYEQERVVGNLLPVVRG